MNNSDRIVFGALARKPEERLSTKICLLESSESRPCLPRKRFFFVYPEGGSYLKRFLVRATRHLPNKIVIRLFWQSCRGWGDFTAMVGSMLGSTVEIEDSRCLNRGVPQVTNKSKEAKRAKTETLHKHSSNAGF